MTKIKNSYSHTFYLIDFLIVYFFFILLFGGLLSMNGYVGGSFLRIAILLFVVFFVVALIIRKGISEGQDILDVQNALQLAMLLVIAYVIVFFFGFFVDCLMSFHFNLNPILGSIEPHAFIDAVQLIEKIDPNVPKQRSYTDLIGPLLFISSAIIWVVIFKLPPPDSPPGGNIGSMLRELAIQGTVNNSLVVTTVKSVAITIAAESLKQIGVPADIIARQQRALNDLLDSEVDFDFFEAGD